jgi:hypothetical protein
MPNIFNK